jgi:hypothetical protein
MRNEMKKARHKGCTAYPCSQGKESPSPGKFHPEPNVEVMWVREFHQPLKRIVEAESHPIA